MTNKRKGILTEVMVYIILLVIIILCGFPFSWFADLTIINAKPDETTVLYLYYINLRFLIFIWVPISVIIFTLIIDEDIGRWPSNRYTVTTFGIVLLVLGILTMSIMYAAQTVFYYGCCRGNYMFLHFGTATHGIVMTQIGIYSLIWSFLRKDKKKKIGKRNAGP